MHAFANHCTSLGTSSELENDIQYSIDSEIKMDLTEEIIPSESPWSVPNVSEFLKYCCPECDYKCEEAHLFCEHALDFHKNSNVLLENWRDEKYQTNVRQEILLEVEPELTLENQDIHMHDFDYEALKSEGEDDIGSDYVFHIFSQFFSDFIS